MPAMSDPTTPMRPAPASILSGLCLQYLFLLRGVIISGQLAAVFVSNYILAMPPAVLPVVVVIAALTVFTLVSWRFIKPGVAVSEHLLLGQLSVDVFGMAALLLFAGGAANPFASLLLVPVIVAAALLRPALTGIVALEAVVCYTALMFTHLHPLYIEVHPPEDQEIGHDFTIHIWGMWWGFLFSAGVVAYFVAKMGATLRLHEQKLAEARERALEANQLVVLGTLAAGTAHELGTPLGTMAIVAKEMEREQRDPTFALRIALLRDQINRCKGILANMAARAGQAQADAGRRVRVDRYLEDLVAEWRGLRPGVALASRFEGPRPAPEIVADRTLDQAILNVLNNAADAATRRVDLEVGWSAEALTIEVADDGAGLAPEVKDRIGEPFVTTKPSGKGMGLGLYLARGTLNRLGGELVVGEAPGTGVRATIRLSLAPLLAPRRV
jgi:two-component system sensor histidine kinase RegB